MYASSLPLSEALKEEIDLSTTIDSLVRTHGDQDIPAAGTYTIDTSHSAVEFVGRHLGLAKVRGRFTDFNGTIAREA